MFNDVQPKNQSTQKEPEDILGEVDKVSGAGGQPPVQPPAVSQQPQQSIPAASPPTEADEIKPALPVDDPSDNYPKSGKRGLRMALIAAAIIAVVVVLALLGMFFWQKFTVDQEPAINSQSAAEFEEEDLNQNANQAGFVNEAEKTELVKELFEEEEKTAPLFELDSDADGLTDSEERKLGTDPYSPDSDLDGLFDKEEVEIYQTDPLVADSDGDGYSDGEEVKGGYNPLGAGRLYNIE